MALTKKDIEKLKDVFATKDDLKGFATKDDLKNFATKDDLSRINENIDWLIGAFRKMQEDLTVRFSQYRRHDDQLENHELRIKKIEEKIPA